MFEEAVPLGCCAMTQKRILSELLKHCSVLDMSRPTYRLTECHNPDNLHCQQHSCECLRSHKSPLLCMCWSPEVLIILPSPLSPRTIRDTARGCYMLSSHQQHCSERSNQVTGEKYIKVHWRGNEQLESRVESQTMGHLLVVVQSLFMYVYVYFLFLYWFHKPGPS